MNAWAFGFALLILFVIGLFVVQLMKFHRCKYDKPVDNDGYQYCSQCGKGSQPLSQLCQHKWKTIKDETIIAGTKKSVVGRMYTLE
ncbi:hypothetical protein LCGC14_1383790, partial [marine sediment metagenome]